MRTNRDYSHLRRLRSVAMLLALLAALLAPPRPARAAFSASLAGQIATMVGDSAGDTLSIDVDASGLLHHNRAPLGDSGFADNFYFDTSAAGSQTITAGPGVTLVIQAGGGADTVVIGSLAGRAGLTITIATGDGDDIVRFTSPYDAPAQTAVDGGAGSDELIYDDRIDSTARTFTIASGQVGMTGGATAGYVQLERLEVLTGKGQDTVDVQSTAAATPLFVENPLATNSSVQDNVNIGNGGSTQGILGAVNISNQAAFTRLTVDDSADTEARAVGIADGQITGIAPAAIVYSQTNEINGVDVRGGNGGNTFTISSVDPTLVKSLASGSGADTFV